MCPVPQVPAPPPTPTLGIQAYDMLGFKLELARMQDASTPRTGFSLSVTDLTAAEWCALQTAYQTATGRRKAATASMTQGSNIHEQLEREVIVDQVDVEVDSAEDELALQLLNAVAAIRQLVLEGLTRELRMFAKIRGQWLVGVIDQLELTEEGKVSMTETKTRRKKEKPPAEQVTTARLQVCMYQVMYDSFRSLTLPQLHEYLFRVSTSHVGLDPQRPLGPSLAAHMALLLADQQAQPPHSPGSSQAQPEQPSDPPAPAPALDLAETAASAMPALTSGPAQAALNTAQPPAVPVSQGVDLPNHPQHAQPAAASNQSGFEQASDDGRVSLQPLSPSSPEAPSQADVAGGLAAQAATPPITLADAIQLLHDSLRLLPPPGTHHKLEYLWQEDRFERLKDEEVEFDGQWLEERLEAALDLWQGRAEPQAAPKGSFKCKFCDFRPQCKVYVPSHPLAEPVALARQTLEERRQAARSRQAAEAVEVAATVLAPA
ncbi:exonuclease V [Haematococcus lacustris]